MFTRLFLPRRLSNEVTNDGPVGLSGKLMRIQRTSVRPKRCRKVGAVIGCCFHAIDVRPVAPASIERDGCPPVYAGDP